jgi:hypothetical protein
MYGDGEYVVEFNNVSSPWAPLRAAVFTPNGRLFTAELELDADRPSVKLAARLITETRQVESSKAAKEAS